MANTPKEPVQPVVKLGAKKQELSMEMRLLISFVLMGVVLFVSPYILKTGTPAPTPEPRKAEQKAAESKAEPSPTPPAAAAATTPPADVASTVKAESQDDNIVIETELYRVVFSNRGAVVRSWILRKHTDNNRKPVDLVSSVGAQKVGYPFSVFAEGGVQLPAEPNQALYAVNRSADGLGVEFTYSDGKLFSRKSFQFDPNRYRMQFRSELRDQNRALPHLVAWRGGFGDFTVPNALGMQHVLYFETAENELTVNEVKVGKDGPAAVTGRFNFAGLEDAYFMAVTLPPTGTSFKVQTWSDSVQLPPENKEEPHIGVAFGGDGVVETPIYVGPKDVHILKAIDPKLEQAVDFGWFWFLARPLFDSLNYLNDKFIHNYGWSIVVLTVLINILLLPLKISSLRSMKKMSGLQPQITQIQAKYKDMPMRDPRKQQQQQEMMDLYQKHGINPLGGCVPMMLQMPFLFAFYKVLSIAVEMRGAQWLWVADLSQPEQFSLRILPLATLATQFLMQKMTPTTTADPQQQRIMMIMPLMFIPIFWNVASGLVLYWLTGNVVGIVQQWFFNRTMGMAPQPAKTVQPQQPKKKGK